MAAQLHREVVKKALAQDTVSEARPLVLFFDLDAFRAAIRDLHSAFPKHFLHTLAVKANPTLRSVIFFDSSYVNPSKFIFLLRLDARLVSDVQWPRL